MRAVNIDDLREIARKRLPRIFFDYLDGGSYSETTMRSNTADFDRLVLAQRILAGMPKPDLSTNFLGRTHAAPFMLAPIGFAGLMAHNGEVLAARAAHAAGLAACVSTVAVAAVQDVAAGSPNGPLYFQLYVLTDRDLADDMLTRAAGAGVDSIFLTVDTVVTPARERDVRNNFRSMDRPDLAMLADLARRPRWCLDMARGSLRDGHLPEMGNVRGRADMGKGIMAQAGGTARKIDPGLSWSDLDWVRARWKGRLVVKGILHPDDARRAIDHGADAIVVSNHGGRQLDAAPSTISALPAIVAAVGGRSDILFDSGVRRGTHIVKALGLGANGILVGRAYIYGLAAGGQAGVASAIEMLRAEVEMTMTLMGVPDIATLRANDGLVTPRLL